MEPVDNAEPGPTVDSDQEPTLDLEPANESTIESKPAIELESRIDSFRYSSWAANEGFWHWDHHSH